MSEGSGARGSSGTPAADRGLVRHVRRRLVLWSGGITVVILLALGTVVYIGVGSSLKATSETLLRERADQLAVAAVLTRDRPAPSELGRLPVGIIFGGRASGTLAVVITPDGSIVGGPPGFVAAPDPDGASLARSGGTEVVREIRFGEVPIRALSRPVTIAGEQYVVQVAADRDAEERTLGQLAIVMLIGGLGALVLAIGGGWLYASRALLPIRESLRRQREFAADASHELRTPLAVARAGMEYVGRHPTARVAEMDETLGDVRAGLDHMADLVDTLLLLARADSDSIELEMVDLDLADLAATALAGLATLATERGVQLHLDAVPVEMAGDPLRLRQLVTILVDNAIRHGRQSGNAWVRVAREGAAPGGTGPPELVVEDDGPGVPAADRNAVFERFWRGSGAAPGGSGLGLSIAAWIAERHRATIEVTERPGGGARFRVRFPRTDGNSRP
jgi:two-component system, OmpR family, sensor histidine kinase CiaH